MRREAEGGPVRPFRSGRLRTAAAVACAEAEEARDLGAAPRLSSSHDPDSGPGKGAQALLLRRAARLQLHRHRRPFRRASQLLRAQKGVRERSNEAGVGGRGGEQVRRGRGGGGRQRLPDQPGEAKEGPFPYLHRQAHFAQEDAHGGDPSRGRRDSEAEELFPPRVPPRPLRQQPFSPLRVPRLLRQQPEGCRRHPDAGQAESDRPPARGGATPQRDVPHPVGQADQLLPFFVRLRPAFPPRPGPRIRDQTPRRDRPRGERTFQTWYSPTSGGYGALFEGGRAEIERRCVRIDDLASKLAKRANAEKLARSGVLPSRTKEQRRRTFRSMRRKLAKERKKVHDWMECGHYSCANFLLSKFDVVIAPHLPVADLVPRNGRVFGSKAARSMLTWSHGLFCSRLKSASFRWAGRHVLTETGEPGTSKTCARCGHWHSELGAKEVFACPRCGVRMERDVAGARNNFFAAFGKAIGIGWDGLQH